MTTKMLKIVACAALCALVPAVAADAAPTRKKAMWGPPTFHGKSLFPTYRSLGVGIWQAQLAWNAVAQTKPAHAADPHDPAYAWPEGVTFGVREARKHGIQVMLQIQGAPPWANGGRPSNFSPRRAKDLARFATAAARRYRKVKYWMVWGEPTRRDNFRPLLPERRDRRLTKKQRRGPQRYAQLLDAAYGALKSVRRSNKVIGGNTFTTGDVSPKNWIRYMKLPGGRRARMDFWGHNPFGYRKPDLSDPPLGHGFVDFGTLDTMARWLDRYQRKGLKLFLSEYTMPTDHPNHDFNFYATRDAQARYVKAALRITRRWKRIYTLGWHELFDEKPQSNGLQTNRGLMTYEGKRKKAFYAWKRG